MPHLMVPFSGGGPLIDLSVGVSAQHPKSPMVLLTVPVIATELTAQGISALIGRDVLSSCLLIYDGAGGSFTLAF